MTLTNKFRGLPLAWLFCASLLMIQTADASTLRGFNFLQDSQTALDSSRACQSIQNLRQTGANSIILVPYMEQESPQSTTLFLADNVSDWQLISGIREAKRQGLHVIVKPIILINGSWPGRIQLATDADERKWFNHYIDHILHYAKLAEQNNADAFVIATEMKRLRKSKYWPDVIQAVRSHFSGQITYGAHNMDGVDEFAHWGLLDSISVTLFPNFPKKANADQALALTNQVIDRLGEAANSYDGKAVWVLEIGMPSAEGWEHRPWDWRNLRDEKPRADGQMQALILQAWLTAVDRSWIEGIWIWNWKSSPQAGGENDVYYTVQNKPAQSMIQTTWWDTIPMPNNELDSCEN